MISSSRRSSAAAPQSAARSSFEIGALGHLSWGVLQAGPAFELTGRGEVIGVGTPQTGFEFSACECGIQGLLELLQVVGGGQFALAPQALRSEERRVGKGCVGTGRCRWWTYT